MNIFKLFEGTVIRAELSNGNFLIPVSALLQGGNEPYATEESLKIIQLIAKGEMPSLKVKEKAIDFAGIVEYDGGFNYEGTTWIFDWVSKGKDLLRNRCIGKIADDPSEIINIPCIEERGTKMSYVTSSDALFLSKGKYLFKMTEDEVTHLLVDAEKLKRNIVFKEQHGSVYLSKIYTDANIDLEENLKIELNLNRLTMVLKDNEGNQLMSADANLSTDDVKTFEFYVEPAGVNIPIGSIINGFISEVKSLYGNYKLDHVLKSEIKAENK